MKPRYRPAHRGTDATQKPAEAIDVRRADDDSARWNREMESSPQATALHRAEALEEMATFSGTSVTRLVGFDDDELVGLFPLFALTKGPVTAVFSPPPHLWIQKLGPVFVNPDGSSNRATERRRHGFLAGVFEWLESELEPGFVRVLTSDRLDDARPFDWNGYEVTPEYTYVVDLRCGKDELLQRFSSDARRNIRNGDDAEFEIELGEGEDIPRLMEQVNDRYEAQDVPFDVPPDFPRALYDRLPTGHIRPYVFRADGEFEGGILAYDDGQTVGRWFGGVKSDDVDVDVAVNDLLDWFVMRDAVERGRRYYDLIGAGDPRINRYKAKFSPQLRTFYRAERATLPVKLLLRTYRLYSEL